MRYLKTYTCKKCGKQFVKNVGGVVMSPKEMELELRPICDRCKLKNIAKIFGFDA